MAKSERAPKAGVVELLNDVLTAELTAINQYFLHAKMCGHWGYERLAAKVRDESIGEMRHADELIERILLLGGTPNVQRLAKIRVGETVVEQLRSDLALEQEGIVRLNAGIELCRQAGDNGSRNLLEKILLSEESHMEWLEAQLDLVRQVGEPAYLAEQIHK